MSAWIGPVARLNDRLLSRFGTTVTHYPQDPPGATEHPAPQDLVAMRGVRQHLESETLAAFERVWSLTSLFAIQPCEGDSIEIGSQMYTIHLVRPDEDADSDGVTVYLAQCPND